MKPQIRNFGPQAHADVARALALNARDHQMILTPIVSQPSDGTRGKRYYFSVLTGPKFEANQVECDDAEPEAIRDALLAELVRIRPPLVIHLMGSELDAARLAAALWTCAKTKKLRAAIEAEVGAML